MLGFGILTAGGIFLWAALTGRAEKVLSALRTDLSHINPGNTASTSGGSGGGNNALVGHFTVNLPGGGDVTVNANSAAAAIENVKVETGKTGTVKP